MKPTTTEAILKRIHSAYDHSLPRLEGMHFVRFVHENGNDFAWAMYVSHDPCHDSEYDPNALGPEDDPVVGPNAEQRDDRNTVIAFHRSNGKFRVIGRELPLKDAFELAREGVITTEPRIAWRGSVTDLATDIRGLLNEEQIGKLRKFLDPTRDKYATD